MQVILPSDTVLVVLVRCIQYRTGRVLDSTRTVQYDYSPGKLQPFARIQALAWIPGWYVYDTRASLPRGT